MPVESKRLEKVALFMNNKDPIHNGVATQSEFRSDRSTTTAYSSTSRKEKPASIFSFLQRLRGRNRNIFEDVTSLPSSPRTIRRPQKPRCRWESAESILSTATANSFAFIPPSQLRGGPRLLHPSTSAPDQPTHEGEPASATPPTTSRDNTVFLRRKYNLLGSDASLCPNERKRSLKNLYRNSVGNVENLRVEGTLYNDVAFSSFRRPAAKPSGLIQRPKSEYSISGGEFGKSRKVYCHRPGKGRAPPPPVSGTTGSRIILSKSTSRKKRKAPSPPEMANTVAGTEVAMTDIVDDAAAVADKVPENEVEEKRKEPEVLVCNDSLKLEKGQLKANNRSLTIGSTNSSISSDPSIPVSPKPWYKRSSVRNSKKTSSKKKTPEQLLDEWILEAGLPRSSSFGDSRKIILAPQTAADQPAGNKRKSQISILANISELDREAAEIVQKERKKEYEMAASFDDRFYDPTPLCSRGASWNKYGSTKDAASHTSTKRHTSKDLISIINAVTNVTKISVNASFFKDTGISRPICKLQSRKPQQTADGQTSHKLTITELKDGRDTESPASSRSAAAVQKEKITDGGTSNSVPAESAQEGASHHAAIKDAPKPVKPFSSWICPQCTLENPSWKFICEACNKWRPYSVNKINGRPTPLVTPKEDLKLPQHRERFDRASLIEERDQIEKISHSIRKQVYDILTSGENIRNNLSRLKAVPETAKPKSVAKTSECEMVALEKSKNDDLEETRRARLAFFSKNCLNDLNRGEETVKQIGAATESGGGDPKNKYYNEEDRRKLREILKELKESLPKSNLPDRSRLVRQRSDTCGLASGKTENDKFNNLRESLKLSKSIDKSESHPASTEVISSPREPVYSVVVKKTSRKNDVSKLGRQVEQSAKIESTKSQPDESKVVTKKIPAIDGPRSTVSPRTDDKQLPVVKGNVGGSKENKSTVNMTVNRLLKKLQTAIASGQHHEAANIARELARLKVNCNMTRQGTPELTLDPLPKCISVNLHIRRDSTQLVPIPLKLNSSLSINELKDKVSKVYDIVSEKQVWMVRGKLVEDESVSLEQLGANETELFELYLYSSSDKGSSSNAKSVSETNKDRNLAVSSKLSKVSSQVTDEIEVRKNTVHVEEVSTKLKNAQITSKVEENMKLKNKSTPISPPKTKQETEFYKAVNGTHENYDDIKNTFEVDGAAKGTVTHKLESCNRDVTATGGEKIENVPISIQIEPKLEEMKAESIPNERQNNNPTEPETKVLPNIVGISSNLQSDPEEWKCARCTLLNSTKDENCAVCTQPKPRCGNDSKQSLVVDDDRNAEIDKLANYKELVDMEKSDIIPNVEKFECFICLVEYDAGEGVVLKECLHTFCRTCLAQTIQHSSEAEVKCPFRDEQYSCDSVLQEREIKALVTPEVYEQHLARSVKEAENKIQNTFHCKTPNCLGWCIFEDNVNEFLCPVCDKMNCLTCQVIHVGLNCKQYQEIINQESETNADANRTRLMLLEMLEKKEAMTCPTCQVILMKKWGCDWLRCSMCKTEICWVTRGFRWGPKGKGDTSGGCRCGVKGVKCHPRCSYCH